MVGPYGWSGGRLLLFCLFCIIMFWGRRVLLSERSINYGPFVYEFWFILYILIYECRLSSYLFGVRKLNNVGDSISEIWNTMR